MGGFDAATAANGDAIAVNAIPFAEGQPIAFPDVAFWRKIQKKNQQGADQNQLVELVISRDDTVANLSKQLSQAQQLLAKEMASSKLAERDPKVIWFRTMITGLEGAIDCRKAEIKPQVESYVEQEANTEAYDHIVDNPFLGAVENPLSTFSIDVDTASYSNVRRFLLEQNTLPPPGAVRIEEFINYFRYDYPQPKDDKPFSVTTEVASCPWAAEHRLVRIGLKGREIAADKRPPSNLVFLIDVSGSMEQPNKLPLVQESLKLLTKQLTENDHVAIVVYAGNSGLVLPSMRGDDHQKIIESIENLPPAARPTVGKELSWRTKSPRRIS